MQKLQKHRLVLLLGILVALVFFYLGVNTWLESQERKASPPPVVRSKPPVQIKPKTEQVKPQTPKPQQVKKTPEPRKEKAKAREIQKAKEVKKEPEKKPTAKKAVVLKEYIAQIGAFKRKNNAQRSLNEAKKKGFSAFIVEERGLYKVRIRLKAKDLKTALKTARKNFSGAFIVK